MAEIAAPSCNLLTVDRRAVGDNVLLALVAADLVHAAVHRVEVVQVVRALANVLDPAGRRVVGCVVLLFPELVIPSTATGGSVSNVSRVPMERDRETDLERGDKLFA